MRRFMVSLLAALWLAVPAAAQEGAIEDVITRQFEAFRGDDPARAFEFASPTIRDTFRTPENFAAMVRRGYPMVWRPGEVRFGPLREVAGQLWQRVRVRDAQGREHMLDYQMKRVDGAWRINAVQVLKAPGVGV